MKFLNRKAELERLHGLTRRDDGGLAVVLGRRRLGKTRLLLEWAARHKAVYSVADESAPALQRRYLAEAVAARLPGFDQVEYPDWARLLARLARDARVAGWRGPFIIDELPYLVAASPELPSVLQRWLDHEARQARLVVALAGSSQRMMHGIVLSADAPLYGRAREIIDVRPLYPALARQAFGFRDASSLVAAHAAWGGVPRYWELAVGAADTVEEQLERLVLDPLGPLHREPDRLLVEDVPSAAEVRPVLDAIGAGAHRVSEIAARIGKPATALSRPLERLTSLGLVTREVPFGEPPRGSKRSLYQIQDPFFRLWFRVVAPHRALLASGTPRTRRALLERHWPGLLAAAWEELCRALLPALSRRSPLAAAGSWLPPGRWWHGAAPEWDVVAESADGRRVLAGEAKWSKSPFDAGDLERECRALAAKPLPRLPAKFAKHEIERVLFIPHVAGRAARRRHGVHVVSGDALFRQATTP